MIYEGVGGCLCPSASVVSKKQVYVETSMARIANFFSPLLYGWLLWCIGTATMSWIMFLIYGISGYIFGGWREVAGNAFSAILSFVPFILSFVLGFPFIFAWILTWGALKYLYIGLFCSLILFSVDIIYKTKIIKYISFIFIVALEIPFFLQVDIPDTPLLLVRPNLLTLVIVPAIVGSVCTLRYFLKKQ